MDEIALVRTGCKRAVDQTQCAKRIEPGPLEERVSLTGFLS